MGLSSVFNVYQLILISWRMYYQFVFSRRGDHTLITRTDFIAPDSTVNGLRRAASNR